MDLSQNIKKLRERKGLSQKELISLVGLGAPMYSRIETGKVEPSLSTLEKIATALNVNLSELFTNNFEDINSFDSDLVEKVKMIEALSNDEKKTVFSIVDAFVGKKKLKETLNNVLTEINS